MVKRSCLICGKDIWIKRNHAKKGWGKYCSKKCQGKAQIKGKWLECDYCGKKIYRTPKDFKKSKSKKFFCSVSCHCSWENKNHRCGENAPNWVAGHNVYRLLMKRYGKIEKCSKCGFEDKRVLVVHHTDCDRKNNQYDNLEWLCRNCHSIFHYENKTKR
ncbi:MAG: HNH endonuclease [Candidatus Omnitrophota bacterium]|nr:HNH endonuclease [Candidatus Omnitrophota bacterium]